MALDEDWWAEFCRKEEQRTTARRAEFFASGERIPDVDMWPTCPICDMALDHDDGPWACYGCDVEWNRNGENGERYDNG